MDDKQNRRASILLIEDDLEILKLYKLKLTLDGYDVITASDGREGLTKAIAHNPHLILMDIKLPEIDGFKLLKELRNHIKTKKTPIFIISNFDDQYMIERSLVLGANEFIIKTQFTPEEISQKIRDWIK